MNCIIVDDEPNAIDVLKRYAEQADIALLANFRNPLKALAWLHEHTTDLVFLDINMPEIKGIDFVKAMKAGPLVVFTTAYSEYAVASYELNAIDYLVKPVSFERFLKAAARARERLALRHDTQEKHVLLKSGSQLHRVLIEDILFVEKEANYLVFTTAGKRILVRANMNEVFDFVPEDKFCQVHKSFVIALNKIDTIEVHQVVIGRHKIPVGGSFRETFMARLNG
ncbi:MAG TPA: LytTR family DNA-binding domain-containing protein [Chitinophagaceae bacterium]|nr:LytTR family DNA-binding domain-containing protein [Chitinophagaceae bacterium]